MKPMRGQFVWHDLMTTDIAAAKAFYTETIGWSASSWEGGAEMEYWMFAAEGTNIGGVMGLQHEGAPPHWISYVLVDDVAATAQQAKELGGAVHKGATDIPEVGEFAIVADPQGAAFALFKPKSAMDLPERNTPGNASWVELNTTDWEGAWSFYSKLLDWEESSRMDMGEENGGTYFMFKAKGAPDDHSLGGMSNVATFMKAPPHWLPYFNAESCQAASDRITSKGGKLLNGPMEVPGGGVIAQFTDPQGAAFAVYAEAK